MRNFLSPTVLVIAGMATVTSVQAASATASNIARSTTAVMVAQTCAGCHGTEGYTEGGALMPLAGMPQKEFINAMESFANKSRPSTVMGSISRNVTKEEIKAMAAYFASFPEPKVVEMGGKS